MFSLNREYDREFTFFLSFLLSLEPFTQESHFQEGLDALLRQTLKEITVSRLSIRSEFGIRENDCLTSFLSV